MRYLILICLLQVGAVYAQQKNLEDMFVKNGSIGVEGGLSLPIFDYGSKSNTLAAGYAMPGYQIRASIGYEFDKFIGLRVTYLYNNNAFDEKAYAAHGSGDPYVTLDKFTSGAWIMNGVLFGLYYPMRMANTTVEVRGMAGFMNSTLPEQNYFYTNHVTNQQAHLQTNEASANDAAYLAGIGVRHQLNKYIVLTGGVDFMYSEQKFENLVLMNLTTGVGYYLDNYTQYYHIIGVNLGLAFQF